MSPSRPDDQLAIVLGQRQLIAVCCMFLVTMGLVATLAYVSGRSITAAQFAETPCAVERASAVLLERVSTSVPATFQARVTPLPVLPLSEPKPQAPAGNADGPPSPGSAFWQVGVVDRGISPVFVEHLGRMGLHARSASAGSPKFLRVLVGPLPPQEIDSIKKTLDKAGFQFFLKKY